jgi:sugar/nucleoside kinase (ribokinase family)
MSSDRPFDIVAVGDLNIDLILPVDELPQFGREVLARSLSRHPGGVAANFASYCARLGLQVALVARVGDDESGVFLVEAMRQAGVCTDFIKVDEALGTGTTVSLSGPHDRAFVTYLGTIDSLTGPDIPDDLLRRTRFMHVGSYFMQTKLQPDLPALFARATQAGVTTSLDTGYDPYERWDNGLRALLPQVDLFLPNEVEVACLGGQEEPLAAAAALPRPRLGIALKLGAQGSRFLGTQAQAEAPVFAVQIADTTCCGDAFDAGFVAAWLNGGEPAECLRWGNAMGALVGSGPGNMMAAVSRAAVEGVLRTGRVGA